MAGDNVQMFILGSLTQGEAYGYQLLARAKRWGVEKWAGFGAGSIYNALKSLEKRGLIVRCGTEQHGGYAPATRYEITEEGHAELVRLMQDTAGHVDTQDPFDLVTAFFGLLPVEERLQLIEKRLAAIEQSQRDAERHEVHIREHVAAGQSHDWVLAAMTKGREMGDVALDSARELRTRCETWGPPEPLGRSGGAPEHAAVDAACALDEGAAVDEACAASEVAAAGRARTAGDVTPER